MAIHQLLYIRRGTRNIVRENSHCFITLFLPTFILGNEKAYVKACFYFMYLRYSRYLPVFYIRNDKKQQHSEKSSRKLIFFFLNFIQITSVYFIL